MTEEKKMAAVFKAMADENRVRILRLLHSGEKCACILLDDLQIAQPTLSHHMKILCDAELVSGRKVGKWMYIRRAVQYALPIRIPSTRYLFIGQIPC